MLGKDGEAEEDSVLKKLMRSGRVSVKFCSSP
jgi:hypothetical protein